MQSDLQFTPELLALWRRCRRLQLIDPYSEELREVESELDRCLGVRPWETTPLRVGDHPSPYPAGSMGDATWRPAQQLRRRLDAALRQAKPRSPVQPAREREAL
jgi:hypothetical protein